MKKLFVSMLICLSFLMLAGCSSKTSISPDEVATNYLNGLVEQNFDIFDQHSVVEYEKIQKPIIEEAMRKNSMTEVEVYEKALSGEDVEKMPTNYEEYKKVYTEVVRKKLEKEYGENYSVKTTVVSSTDIAEEDKDELLKEASDYYDRYNVVISDIIDFSKIAEIKKMQCKAYLSGTKETTEDFSIYVVKINDEWKVLNLGTGA